MAEPVKAEDKPKVKGKPKAKMGRPKKKFNLKQVEIFGLYGGSYEDMSVYFGCHVATIARQMQKVKSDFSIAYKKGRILTKLSLASKQREVALKGKGNVTMLIWLGKQCLGQTDKTDTTSKGEAIRLVETILPAPKKPGVDD